MGVDGAGRSGALYPVGHRAATKQHNAFMPLLPVCRSYHSAHDVDASIFVGLLDLLDQQDFEYISVAANMVLILHMLYSINVIMIMSYMIYIYIIYIYILHIYIYIIYEYVMCTYWIYACIYSTIHISLLT